MFPKNVGFRKLILFQCMSSENVGFRKLILFECMSSENVDIDCKFQMKMENICPIRPIIVSNHQM